MKRTAAFLVCMALIFSLLSCGNNETEKTTGVSGGIPTEQQENRWYYPSVMPFAETPTRILYINRGTLFYHNKMTDEETIFCFDPLCEHGAGTNCIAYRFGMAGGLQTVAYCEANSRFYALRGDQFCSFAFDGSDLRVEHSFGEAGAFDTLQPGDLYGYGSLYHLQVEGRYVFFIARNQDTGKPMLLQFAIDTKKISTVFYDENTSIMGYQMMGETVYISLAGDYNGLYQIHVGETVPEKISNEIYPNFTKGIFAENTIYFVTEKKATDRKGMAPDRIMAFHTADQTVTEVEKLETSALGCQLLAANDNYLYYTLRDKVTVGYQESKFGRTEVTNQCCKIYRLHRETGETTVVLDDPQYGTEFLYFYDNHALIIGRVATPSETNARCQDAAFIATIDENGYFH